jgi:hypothetical protein
MFLSYNNRPHSLSKGVCDFCSKNREMKNLSEWPSASFLLWMNELMWLNDIYTLNIVKSVCF